MKTYTDYMRQAVDEVRRSGAASELGPMASGAFDLISSALASAPAGADAALIHAAMSAINEATSIAISELGTSIPLFGTVLGMVLGAITGTWGTPAAPDVGPCSEDPQIRSQWCRRLWNQPKGTGPGLQLVPADLFAPTWSVSGETPLPDAHKDKWIPMSSPGQALMWVTEYDSMRLISDLVNAPRPPGWPLPNWLKTSTGLSAVRRAAYRALRIAMAASYKVADGGKGLFSVYLDMLRVDFAKNRLTEKLAEHILRRHLDQAEIWNCSGLGSETCLTHDPRWLDYVLDMVRGWDQTVNPFYSKPDSKMAMARVVSITKDMVGIPPRGRTPAASAGPVLLLGAAALGVTAVLRPTWATAAVAAVRSVAMSLISRARTLVRGTG